MTPRSDDELLDMLDGRLRSMDGEPGVDGVSVPASLRARFEATVAARREIVAWLDHGDSARRGRPGLRDYDLVERVGRGGQGEVWRAIRAATGEVVAVKLLSEECSGDVLRVRRFRREAEVAARLEHASLARVLAAGEECGRPFLVMRFVDGLTIDRHLDHLNLQPDERVSRVCSLCAQLAEGLAAAHASGIVHRDIKPGNVRVGSDEIPVLVDFGLAMDSARPGSLTGEAVVGTPAYLPPEALAIAGPMVVRHDERSDVWSFGVMLYELLTGQQPFQGPTRQALYRAIVEEPAGEPRLLNRAVGAGLALVVRACLEKRPADRYRSAGHLAVDLRRVIAGKRPLVRRPSPAVRSIRWLRDNPALGLAGAALAVGLAVSLVFLRQARVAEGVAGEALSHEREARIQSDGLRLVAESLRVAGRAPGLAVRLAVEAEERLAGSSAEARVVDALVAAMEAPWECGVWQLGEGAVRAVAFSADGESIWAGGDDGAVYSIRLVGDSRVEQIHVGDRAIRTIQPLAGGGVVAADVDGICSFVAPDRRTVVPSPDGWGGVTALAVSADYVATGSVHGDVCLWIGNGDGGWTPGFRVRGHRGEVSGLDLRDGELASCSLDGCVRVWSTPSGELLASHERSDIELTDVALGPGGRRILIASEDNRMLGWGLGSEERESGAAGHASGLYSVAYDSTGSYAVTSSFDRTAILWRVRDLHLLRRYEGHRRAVHDAEFSPDGKWVVTASDDGTVRLWPAFGHPEAQSVNVGRGIGSASFAGGGARVIVSGDKSAAGLWSLETSERALVPCEKGDAFAACAVSETGDLIGVVTSRGRVRILRAGTGEQVRSWPPDDLLGLARCGLSFSPKEKRLLVTNDAGVARLYDVDGARAPRELRGLAPFYRVGNVVRAAFLDEQRVATVVEEGGRGVCIVWGVDDGLVAGEWDVGVAPISSMVRHPAAPRLLVSHGVGRVSEWQQGRGTNRQLVAGDSVVTSARYAPRGNAIVATDRAGAIWLWDGTEQVRGRRIDAHESVAYDACIDPLGKWIASASWDGSAALWDLATLRRVFRVQAHDAPVIDVGFAPEGGVILTAGEDGTVRTWPVDPIRFVRRQLRTRCTDLERAQFVVGAPR